MDDQVYTEDWAFEEAEQATQVSPPAEEEGAAVEDAFDTVTEETSDEAAALSETRQALLAVQAEASRHAEQTERLLSSLRELGYTGSTAEIADMLEAQRRETSPAEVRAQREAQEAQALAMQEAERLRLEARSLHAEAVFSRDLSELQALDPNIKRLEDLGETFFRLRAAGVPNMEAFSLLAGKGQKKELFGGKEHLHTTGGGCISDNGADIPPGEIELWKDSFPDDSPAKLKARYRRALKRQGE